MKLISPSEVPIIFSLKTSILKVFFKKKVVYRLCYSKNS